MIENPFCSRKFYGEYDLVTPRRLEVEVSGNVAGQFRCLRASLQ